MLKHPRSGNGTTAASQQVSLTKNSFGVTAFSVDGKFSAAPGAFEIDVHVAQTDSDTNYQTISNGDDRCRFHEQRVSFWLWHAKTHASRGCC